MRLRFYGILRRGWNEFEGVLGIQSDGLWGADTPVRMHG
jgi:hypothetical protein